MSRSRSVSSACSIKFRASQCCGIKTMGRVPRLALERGRYQGEPEHYLPHRTQGTEKREGPALYPEEQNRQPYPSASRISSSDLEPSSDATSDLEPSSHPTPRSAEWFPPQPRPQKPREASPSPLAAATQLDSEQFRSSPRTSRLLWRMIIQQPKGHVGNLRRRLPTWRDRTKRLTPRSTLGSGKLKDRTMSTNDGTQKRNAF